MLAVLDQAMQMQYRVYCLHHGIMACGYSKMATETQPYYDMLFWVAHLLSSGTIGNLDVVFFTMLSQAAQNTPRSAGIGIYTGHPINGPSHQYCNRPTCFVLELVAGSVFCQS